MKERSIHLDVAKGLCLLLMIAGHTKGINPTLNHLIYSFHMPAFFIIAGMTHFSSTAAKPDLVWSKFKRLIIPAWVFGAINGLPFLGRVLRGTVGLPEFIHRAVGTFTGAAQTNDTFNCTPLWFLYAIFFVYLFEILGREVLAKKSRSALVGVLLIFLCITPATYTEFLPIQIRYALTGILFFQIGVLLKELFNAPVKDTSYLWFAILVLAWLVPAMFTPTVQLNSGYLGNGPVVLLSTVVALVGTFLIIQMARMLSWLPLLPQLAQISIPIVGLNYLIEQRINLYVEGLALFVIEVMILMIIAALTMRMGTVGRVLNGRV
ncbi:acyltransferase family protein [Herbaspirillum sp. CAH-3]|uniref:acyltransferase family protein n=1 Tax=Herbaspirillum sp. CAH-3 TaxID=2605746 RepID=UPI0012AC833C|nr:acyltransferase family protein [Herbaspirillum sp. CAH-3]MRT31306.1 acyltransferase family protein [Herbaspirillum sp. CAH-3]